MTDTDDSSMQQPANDLGPDAALQTEVAQLKDRLLRALAETENVRKRGEREADDARQFGIARFARDLLSVADNLRRALDSVPAPVREAMDEQTKTMLTGVELTEKELLNIFERFGVKRIWPKGEKFNPNYHQAIAEVPGTGLPAGIVVDVVQAGYLIGDRLLRAAMVAVARGDAVVAGAGLDTTA